MRFEGRVALVSGGGRGIGRATALRLAREGAMIAVVDRDADPAQAVAREVGGLALIADIVADDAGPQLVAEAERVLGPLDVLVNNAAHTTQSTLAATEPADWDCELAVTLRAAWLIARAVLPASPRECPVGRVGTPEDIAAYIAFLAADEAAFVNGANLVGDGGLTTGMGLFMGELRAGAN